MRSSKRVLALAVAAAAVAGFAVLPSQAQAQSCVPVPVSTIGLTIEGGGQEVRIPAVSSVAVCYELPGATGIPWVVREPDGGVSVLVTASSGNEGSVGLRYTADGVTNVISVPIPGTGGNDEICLVGVGFPARSDCEFKVSPDTPPTLPPVPTTPPVPTLPPRPTPTVPPLPTPTVPPVPSVPPAPTVPPLPPVPDDVCVDTPDVCLSTVGELIERLPEIIERLPWAIEVLVGRLQDIVACQTNPEC